MKKPGVAIILGVAALIASFVPNGVSADEAVLPGCLGEEALRTHVGDLAAADWSSFDRARIVRQWPDELRDSAREAGSNEVVGFEWRGRVINWEIQCGFTYLFARHQQMGAADTSARPRDVFRLRSVSLFHASRSKQRALELARWLTRALGVPADAKGRWRVMAGARETRPVLFDQEYAWRPLPEYRQLLSAKVIEGDQAVVLEARWTRETR